MGLLSAGFRLLVAVLFIQLLEGRDSSGGGAFDSCLIALQPEITCSVPAAWMAEYALIDAESQMVEIPVAPVWMHSGPEAYAVTVVFQDDGDGGPALEWRGASGDLTVLSHGLGGIGAALGLNSRTVLVPKSLTRDGGAILVSYYGNFEALISLAVAPLREDIVSVSGLKRSPALIDSELRVFEDRDLNGSRPIPLGGDLWSANIIKAELAAEIEPLKDTLEFVVPIKGEMEGAMLRLETLGLDPAAKIQIAVNGLAIGSVNMPGFQLDDPSLVMDWNGSLIYAGWRSGSLFIPVVLLKENDNSLVLTLERSTGETGRDVFLRNAAIHIRFKHTPAPLLFDSPQAHFPANPAEIDFNLIDPILPEAFLPPSPTSPHDTPALEDTERISPKKDIGHPAKINEP